MRVLVPIYIKHEIAVEQNIYISTLIDIIAKVFSEVVVSNLYYYLSHEISN